jgi:hypothetical protein
MSWAAWQTSVPQDRTSVFLTADPFQTGAQLGFASRGAVASRSNVPLVLPVYLSTPVDKAVDVTIGFVPGTAGANDIVLHTPILHFMPYQRMRAALVTLRRDVAAASAKDFALELVNPVGAVLGTVPRQTITIAPL